MPPKTAPAGKNVPSKNPPSRGAQTKSSPTRGVKGGKKAKDKQKGRRLKLKGWLETKADWVKFDAWANINAQPRKIPEPEPLIRASKPLAKMMKQIAILSMPRKQPDISKTCRSDLSVSKKALTAKPSKRILELAMFVVKNIESCREFPLRISRAALRYKASKRIIEISRPHDVHFSEFCKLIASEGTTLSKDMTASAKRLAVAKKAIECPDLMTDEEINVLMTPTGIYRSALEYKFTPWMTYLALPSYRFLKDQTHEQAEEWKTFILEENEVRGKKALEYKKKKEEREKKRAEDSKRLEENKNNEEVSTTEETKETTSDEEREAIEATGGEQATEVNEPVSATDDSDQSLPTNDRTNNEETSRTGEKTEASPAIKQKKLTAEEEEAAKRRKEERNAWRFTLPPCKDNPFEIKKSALKGKVSPRMAELAKPNIHEDKSCRKKPFEVRKSALDGPIPERMTELAKPNHPRDPVEKEPPREKDSFGRPVFPKPPYGKKMPHVKPYQEAECPEKDKNADDEEEKKKKKEERKQRIIDPIVYEATIDPCIDPDRAKRQLNARKAAKEEIERRNKEKEATAKEGETKEPGGTD